MKARTFFVTISLLFSTTLNASWLSDATGINIDLNRQVGTGISSMAGPSFERAEETGRRLIGEADAAMKARIDQVDLVAQTNIGRVDTLLEKRLIQADEIAARRIDQVDMVLAANISRIDSTMKAQIDKADELVGRRLIDVDGIVAGALSDLDGKLATRIAELDEIAERRIGTLDTLSTKATLAFEQTVRRLILTGCLLMFLTAALWRLYAVALPAWLKLRNRNQVQSPLGDIKQLVRQVWRPLVPQIAMAFLVAISIYLLYLLVPGSPAREAQELRAEHEAAFDSSLRNLQLREARYYAAQLRLLAPGEPRYAALLQKAELIRDVLERPALTKASGVRSLDFRVRSIDRALGGPDPDVLALGSMLAWRAGRDRTAELGAAILAADALSLTNEPFALMPVAVSYLRNYLSNPLPPVVLSRLGIRPKYSQDQFTELLRRGNERLKANPDSIALLASTLFYNQKAAELQATSQKVYPALIEAVARRDASAVRQRSEELMSAWKGFDRTLAEDELLNDSTLGLAAFELRDADFTRACWYKQSFAGAVLPSTESLATTGNAGSAALCAPPRVYWSKRYLSSLSRETALVTTLEEARRFEELDRKLHTLESAVQQFRQELLGPKRIEVLLRTGKIAAIEFARTGYSSAALNTVASLREQAGAQYGPQILEIEQSVAEEVIKTRTPLV